MHRLFVALRPPPDIRSRLIDLKDGIAAARWQNDDQLHVTLRFIGEVERPVAEDIAAALSAVHAPAPCVCLDGVGRFDRQGRANALWAGLAPHDGLAALHAKVNQACARAGIANETRAFLPHITLARLPRSAGAGAAIDGWIGRNAGLSSGPFTMPHLILYESHLGRNGPYYEAITRWPLGTGTSVPGLPA